MTMLSRAALPLAALLVVPFATASAAPPRAHEQDITITASPEAAALKRWVQDTERRIDRHLRYPKFVRAGAEEGLATVRFMRAPDGAPAAVALHRSSGSGPLDRAALRAVRNIDRLAAAPDGIDGRQVYEARLLFLVDNGSERSMKRKMAELTKDADRQNAVASNEMGRQATASRVVLVPLAAN